MADLQVIRALALVVLVSGTTDSLAHHSDALYSQAVIQVEGEVVSVKWRNPHVTWTLKAVNDAGRNELWVMEAPSTYSMKRAGVESYWLALGEEMPEPFECLAGRPTT